MRRLVKDTSYQEALEIDGFFVKKALLSVSEVETLKGVYEELTDDLAHFGFHATCYSSNTSYRREVFRRAKTVFSQPADQLLEDCEVVSANYVVKEAGTGEMLMHQDWSIVDENKHSSIIAWCPLEDTTDENGKLSVLRASHRYVNAWRGECAPGLPHFFPQFEDKISPSIKERYEVSLDLNAGDTVFYDARLVHFSPPNRTNKARLAINISFVPSEAPLIHSYRSSENTIELLEIEDSFFTDHHLGDAPVGRKVGEVPFQFEILYPGCEPEPGN